MCIHTVDIIVPDFFFSLHFADMFKDIPTFFLFMVKKAHIVKIGVEQPDISDSLIIRRYIYKIRLGREGRR